MKKSSRKKKSLLHPIGGPPPEWLWVQGGCITSVTGDPWGEGRVRCFLPLFHTQEDAKANIPTELWEAGVRPGQIGPLTKTEDGDIETLAAIMTAVSLIDGCEFVAECLGSSGAGEYSWRYMDIPPAPCDEADGESADG